MLRPTAAAIDLLLSMSLAVIGIAGAWLLRRRSLLSVRNLYLPAIAGVLLVAACVSVGWWTGVMFLVPLTAPWVAERRWEGDGG